MIGRISQLGTPALFGIIKADNGLSVRFDHSSVMAYDATGLAQDQLVSFDIEGGPTPRAINICVRKDQPPVEREERRNEPIRLRFMGFEPTNVSRDYRFDQLSTGGDTIHLVVKIGMTLFTKHRVGIQDGPALCLYVLTGESRSAGAGCVLPPFRSLTDADLQGYVESRALAGQASHRNRQLRARGAAPSAGE